MENDFKERAPIGNLEIALHKKNQILFNKYLHRVEDTIHDLASRQQKKPGDTNSSFNHLKSVHSISDRLIPSAKCDNLKDIEIYIYLLSVYLHDIGKIIDDINTSEHHSVTGRNFILNNHEQLKLNAAESIAIAHIVEAHGPHLSIDEIPEHKGIEPYGRIRMRYLSSLLKLSDELEMSYTRAPSAAKAIENPQGKISHKWNVRESIQYVDIDPETWVIKVISTPRTFEMLEVLSKEVSQCNEKLQKLRPFLRASKDIGLYYSYIDLYSDSIMLPKLTQTITTNLDGEQLIDKNYTDDGQQRATVIIDKTQESLGVYDSIIQPILSEKGYLVNVFSECLSSGDLRKRYSTIFDFSDIIIALVPAEIGGASSSFCLRTGAAISTKKRLIFLAFNHYKPLVGDFAFCDIKYFKTAVEFDSIISNFIRENDN